MGDPANYDLTEAAIKLGWTPPEPKSYFDVLPLIIQADNKSPILMKDIPKSALLMVPITHPDHE